MKITIDAKKGAEAVSGFLQKTSDLGKKTVSDVQAGAAALSEKAKQDSYLRRLKKYNPLFLDVYQSGSFNLPNLIMIRDDAERKGIDVCEGAIGWLGNESGMEVLYLYDEFVPECGITFIPSADCDAVYYVDKFDRKKYIRTDCIFKIANSERFAELESIAYSLGAKHCVIDIVEKEHTSKKTKHNAHSSETSNLDLRKIIPESIAIELEESMLLEHNYEFTHKKQNEGHSELTLAGSDKPKRPKLKWFAHDEGIKGLVEMRCKGGNLVKKKTLELRGSNSATMSRDTACRIDSAISCMGIVDGKANSKKKAQFEKQATREIESTFVFTIEF